MKNTDQGQKNMKQSRVQGYIRIMQPSSEELDSHEPQNLLKLNENYTNSFYTMHLMWVCTQDLSRILI